MLKDWLNKVLNGSSDEELVLGPEEQMLSGLNLKEVLDTHKAWKDKLENELSGNSTEVIDVTETAKDCSCTLGKWIYGPGKQQYAERPEYESMRTAHANFHLVAAEVVIEHQSGNKEKAQELLKTRFRNASNSNQLELVKLFTAVSN